jgi:hypothetical protein
MNNMNCELGNTQTGLLAYYKFNQGIGNGNNSNSTSLIDSSGNNYGGNLIGFTLDGAISNWSNSSAVAIGTTCSPFLNTTSFDVSSFNLYPNPTSGIVTISYSKPISEVVVINMLGQTIIDKKTNDLEVQIDLSNFSKATYLVKVISEGAIKTMKVIR